MLNIGLFSYLSGAILYFVLSLLLITSWRGRLPGALIVFAALVNGLWCSFLAYDAYTQSFRFEFIYFLEVIRNSIWLLLLVKVLRGYGDSKSNNVGQLDYVVYGFAGLVFVQAVVLLAGGSSTALSGGLKTLPLFSLLILILLGLVLVEQIYRNTAENQRWAIKFFCLAIGSMFAYDLYVYSHGLLFHQLSVNAWQARGFVYALTVPLMAVSIARNPQWSLNLFISRHVVFYSMTLTGAGIYLIAMAIGGYYIRIYGGSWGVVGQIIFLFGSALILFMVVTSGQVRSDLKIFLAKHFFSNKYDYRIEWLKLTEILSIPSDDESLGQRVVKGVAQIIQARGGCLWIKADNGYIRYADWNMAPLENALETDQSTLVKFLGSQQIVVNVDEFKALAIADRQSKYGDFQLPEWLSSVQDLWLIVPLFLEEKLFGFIVLERGEQVQNLTWEDNDLLKTIGYQVASYLALEQAGQMLSEAKQFEAYNQLTAFIMHDLKNLIAQQSLVVQNAAIHKSNPVFIEDAIETIDNSVKRMSRLMEQLKSGSASNAKERVNFGRVVNDVVKNSADRQPVPDFQLPVGSIEVVVENERFPMIIGHVINNAQDAVSSGDGYVKVNLSQEGNYAVLEVEDNGCGMDQEFINHRLFQPFDTTKGLKGMGIGAYEVREFIQSAGGQVSVESELNEGTRFRIELPIA